ncbi:hypothetical protein C8F01DRAFT_469935 [Mycena amicta]|nr:hypothetical protein C8F01DRAFT_469935 [Mycena amicta]
MEGANEPPRRACRGVLACYQSTSAAIAFAETYPDFDPLSQLIYEDLERRCLCAPGTDIGRRVRAASTAWGSDDVFLMRGGHAMTDFTVVLFAKVGFSASVGDFHSLTSAFRDVSGKECIQASLVRLLWTAVVR